MKLTHGLIDSVLSADDARQWLARAENFSCRQP